MLFSHSIFNSTYRLESEDSNRIFYFFFMANISAFPALNKSMLSQTVTAHVPHINVNRVVIVLDTVETVDRTRKMNFSLYGPWKN